MKFHEKMQRLANDNGGISALARLLKLPSTTVANWINNPDRSPAAATVWQASKRLNVDVEWLLDDEQGYLRPEVSRPSLNLDRVIRPLLDDKTWKKFKSHAPESEEDIVVAAAIEHFVDCLGGKIAFQDLLIDEEDVEGQILDQATSIIEEIATDLILEVRERKSNLNARATRGTLLPTKDPVDPSRKTQEQPDKLSKLSDPKKRPTPRGK